MRFWNRQQLIIVFSMAAMTAGFLLLRYFPVRQKIKAASQAKQQQQMVITKAAAQIQQLPFLAEEVAKLKGQIGNFEAKIPNSRQLGPFLQQITDVMNKHNLREQSVQPDTEAGLELEDIRCIPIDIQCKGRLKQIFSFFKSLKKLDRTVRLEQVELESDSDSVGDVSMRAKAAIYYKAG